MRAYLHREDFQRFWEYQSPVWAGKFLDEWCGRVMRSRLEPLKKVARSLRKHRPLLLNWFHAKGAISAGIVEGFNNKAKLTMRKSYGFREYETIQLALYHQLGNLPQPESTHRFWCAVKSRVSSAGANPARQLSFQPVAIGAAMEVTKSSKPSTTGRYGDSANRQAVTRVNAEQASKRVMREPTQPEFGEGRRRNEVERQHLHGPAGVVAMACLYMEMTRNTGSPNGDGA